MEDNYIASVGIYCMEPSEVCIMHRKRNELQKARSNDHHNIGVSPGIVSKNAQEQMKKLAACVAVGKFVRDGIIVGLGTGSTASYAIHKIGELVSSGWDITGIATSRASEQLAASLGIKLSTLKEYPIVDVTIDGADEVDPALNLIKGMGGALLREKIVAENTRKEIIVVDESKLVRILGTKSPLPVEIITYEYERCQQRIEKLGCVSKLRLAGGSPYISDNGNFILDCRFRSIRNPEKLDSAFSSITGVVENGLFIKLAYAVVIARSEKVEIKRSH